MKTIFGTLLTAFGLMMNSSLPAQSWEHNFQLSFYHEVQKTGPVSGEHWLFLTKATDNPGLPTIFLHRLGREGDEVHFPLFNHGDPLSSDFISLDSSYIAVGKFFECDIITPWLLFRFDQAGNPVWQMNLEELTPLADLGTIRLLPGPAEHFWVITNDQQAFLFDTAGTFLTMSDFGLPLFAGYFNAGPETFIGYGPAGLGQWDRQLSTFQSAVENLNLIKALPLTEGRFIAVDAENLYCFDSVLNLLDTVAHQLPANTPLDLAVSEQAIWLLAQTEPKRLLRFDSLLNPVSTTVIPADAPLQPRFLAAWPSSLILLGKEEQSVTAIYDQVTSVRSLSPDSLEFGAQADAAAVTLQAIGAKPVTATYLGFGYYNLEFDSLQVIIRNEGTTTLQTVTVNGIFDSFWDICMVLGQYRRTFQDLELAPAASVTLDLETFSQIYYLPPPPEVPLCFWTTLPNQQLDVNRANNVTCETFGVVLPAVEPVETGVVQISPNPAQSSCLLQWEEDLGQVAHLQIFDGAGRLMQKSWISGTSWRLERNHWPVGTYTVFVQTREGRLFSGRIVFE